MIRTPSLARNVTLNWVGMALGIVYALIMTPIIAKALEAQAYGAWVNLNALVGYSELLYLGLGGATIRYVAEARGHGDIARINRIASVVFTIFAAIGFGCFLVLIGVSSQIPSMFKDLPQDLVGATRIATVLLGSRLMIMFAASVFTGVMWGHDRFDLINIVSIGSQVIRFIVIPLFLRDAANPLLMIAVLSAITSAIEVAAIVGVTFWYVPGLAVRLTRPKLPELRLLYSFGLQSFFLMVSIKLISYTSTLVIGIKLGVTSVTLYSFPLQLVEYGRMCVNGFSGVLLPRLTLKRSDPEALRDDYVRSTRLGSFVAGWLVAGIISLGPAFISRWIGPEIGSASQFVLVWLGIAAFAGALSTQVPYPFYQALGMMTFPAVVLTLEGVTNLVLTLILAPRYGINGVAFATALPATLITLAVLPVTLCRRLSLPLRSLVGQGVMPGLAMLLATLGTQYLANMQIPADSYLTISVRAAMTLPVAFAVFTLTFPRDEQRKILELLRVPYLRVR